MDFKNPLNYLKPFYVKYKKTNQNYPKEIELSKTIYLIDILVLDPMEYTPTNITYYLLCNMYCYR